MKKAKSILIFSMMAIFLLGGVALADWAPGDPYKMHWPQLPYEFGFDVMASEPFILADDFLCTETGYIEDIHFWGSWKGGYIPPMTELYGFWISIHEDIPADQNPNGPYSQPGTVLLNAFFPISAFIIAGPFYGEQGWLDPVQGLYELYDHFEYFQYNLFLDPDYWVHQEEGNIYWLNISAVVFDPINFPWGWKQALPDLQFLDTSVWTDQIMYPDPWFPTYEPPAGGPLDLAFVITGEPDQQPTVFPVVETECPVIQTVCPEVPVETECPETETKCPTLDTECPVIETHCPVDPTTCPVVETQCPAAGPTICPEIATECPEIYTECPYEFTFCPEHFTYCPEEITWCPVFPTDCPMEPTFCPTGPTMCEFTICDDIPTWCPDDPTNCPVIPTSCPEIPTVCPITPVDTVCPEIATECPATVTECQIIPTECPDDPTYCTTADTDSDGINDCLDNCIYTPNGYLLGTCAEAIGPLYKGTGVTCTSGGDCGTGEVCQMSQEDCNSNGAGDVCECYADFDGDGNVYPSDLSVFLGEYGRTDCLTTPPPCQADFDNDGNVYPSDLSLFLQEYGRTDCPPTI